MWTNVDSSLRIAVFGLLAAAILLPFVVGCTDTSTFDRWDKDNDGVVAMKDVPKKSQEFFYNLLEEQSRREAEAAEGPDGGQPSAGPEVEPPPKVSLTREEYVALTATDWALYGTVFLTVILTITVPFLLGSYLARWLRMPDYGTSLGLILFAVIASSVIAYAGWPPKLGTDLSGGIILVYEIDEERTLQAKAARETDDAMTPPDEDEIDIDLDALVPALNNRINPSGVKDTVVRPYGDKQVQIIIPDTEADDLEVIKKIIAKTGFLDFRILVNRRNPTFAPLVEAADRQIAADPSGTRPTVKAGGLEAYWVTVGKAPFQTNPLEPEYRLDEAQLDYAITRIGARGDREALVYDDNWDVKGTHIRIATAERNQQEGGGWMISFQMKGAGIPLMRGLTSEFVEQDESKPGNQLGIIMDGELLSAARIRGIISDRGQITGTFTKEEVDFIADVLKAGRLPAVLRQEPISQEQISALLGADTIRKGAIAIGISLVTVLVFMIVYYQFSGVVACFALVINLLLVLAVMIAIQASFTLPGFAGLVLTVGMSVDANVLIFERIREERGRGAALRMALRNGFSRATTTIVDANLTTLIVAMVLYAIGNEQLRGFAVTLILGILASMFTAIFCARVVFDIAERKRFITDAVTGKGLVGSLLGHSSINFLSYKIPAVGVSIALIVIGLVAAFTRGRDLYDIDFNGGLSVQILLAEEMTTGEVRQRVSSLPDVTVTAVDVEGRESRVYKIDTSISGFGELGEVKVTNRAGKSTVVDLSGATTPEEVVETIRQATRDADLKLNVSLDSKTGGLEVEDDSGGEGVLKLENADGLKSADKLNIAFATQSDKALTGQLPDAVQIVEAMIEALFTEDGKSLLVMHDVEVGEVKSLNAEQPDVEATSASPPERRIGPPASAPRSNAPRSGAAENADYVFASTGDVSAGLLQAEEADEPEESSTDEARTEEPKTAAPTVEPGEAPTDETPEPTDDTLGPADSLEPAEFDSSPTSPLQEAPEIEPTGDEVEGAVNYRSEVTLNFGEDELSATSVRDRINRAGESVGVPAGSIGLEVTNPKVERGSGQRANVWNVKLTLPPEKAQEVLAEMERQTEASPVWLSSNKIGSQIATNLGRIATAAVVFSLLFIIAYIWIRFQKVAYGLAAVIALVHDVFVTIGAIALSYWLTGVLGFLQVDEFKISLVVIAALLTIIGYSLNDTIVIFDRVREIRGRTPMLTQDMINTSINQTLARTLLTSLTTLIVVVILYFLGGQGIHAFAFCLVVGVVAGTYSTVFIASPALLWMAGVRTHEADNP